MQRDLSNTPAGSQGNAKEERHLPPKSDEDSSHGARSWNLASGLLALLAICLVPAVVGAGLYLQHLRDTAVHEAYGAADLVATGTSESLHWQLLDAQAMLASVATRPQVRALDPNACDPILAEFRSISPSYKTLALRLTDGRSVCSELRQPPSAQSVVAAPWFQAALRQPGFYVSDGHPGTVNQPWTVRLTYPVADQNGRPAALLITPIDLQQLQQRLFGRLRTGSVVAVVDSANRVVVRSTQQDERLGKPAAQGVARIIDDLRREAGEGTRQTTASRQFPEVGIDGVRRLFVVRQVPHSDWMVVSGVAEADTLSGYYEARNRSLVMIVAVLVLASLAAWRVSRSIQRPIQALAEAARALSRGEPTTRVPEDGPTEVRFVAREFNSMVAATARAREGLLASERRYRTLLQHLPVAVMCHSADGSLELFNEGACVLLRLTAAQLQDAGTDPQAWHLVDARGCRVALHDHPAALLLRTRQPLPPTTFGIVVGNAREPHAWALVTGYAQPGGEGTSLQAVVVLLDISAQHEAEQLRLAKESAEAANKAKSEFLSRLSHELRTPLNAISGFSNLMLLDEQLQPHHRLRLVHVVEAGEHLLCLIDQILDIAGIESGQQQVATCSVPLAPLLASCAALCSPLAQAREVQVLTPEQAAAPGLCVRADPTRLRQIVMNLISNAIKYNRPKGSVKITVRLDRTVREECKVCIDIFDTGIGLSAAQLERLFEPFNRVGAERTRVEGHGIGLAHSRSLARAMGGEITVSSQAGEGSCFTLRLHRAPDDGDFASPPAVQE